MKKLAKILVAVLVVMALTGVFAFAVSADETATPWTPGEDVYFARWTTVDSYNNGDEPVEVYTSANLSLAETQTWAGENYVLLYKDIVYAGGGNCFAQDVNVTFDLADHLMTINAYNLLGQNGEKVTLTFKNGSVKQLDCYTRMYNGAVFTIDNVDFVGTQTTYFRVDSAQMNVINGSTLSLDCRSPIRAIASGSTNPTRVNVENSDLVFTHTRFIDDPDNLWCNSGNDDQGGVFTVYYNQSVAVDVEFRVDANSSITTKVANAVLLGIYADVEFNADSNIKVILETGARVKGVKDNINYAYKSTTAGYAWGSAGAAIKADAFVAQPDGTTAIEEYEVVELEGGYFTFVDPNYVPPEEPEVDPWVPADDSVYFARWASFSSYKKGEAPVETYTAATLSLAETQSWAGINYVRLYKDIEYEACGNWFNSDVDVTFELADHTMTINQFGNVGQGEKVKLTYQNGNVTILDSYLRVYNSSTLVLNNVDWVGTGTSRFRLDGAKMDIIGSTVTLNNRDPFYLVGSACDGTKVSVVDSDIICAHHSFISNPDDLYVQNGNYDQGGVFTVYNNSTSVYNVEFRVDANSSISTRVTNGVLLGIYADAAFDANANITLVLEKGVVVKGIKDNINYAYKSTVLNESAWGSADAAIKANVFVAEAGGNEAVDYDFEPLADGSVKIVDLVITEIDTVNMLITDDLALNFIVKAAFKDVAALRFEVTFNGQTYNVAGVALEDGRIQYTIYGIAPQQVDLLINATLYVGDEVVDTVVDYSVAQYVADAKENHAENTKLVTLLDAVNDYSAAAKEYLGGETAGEIVADRPADNSVINAPADEANRFTGAGIKYDYNNSIYVNIQAAGEFVVTVNGVAVEAFAKGNGYVIYINVTPADFDESFEIALVVDEVAVHTITYSVNDYIARIWDTYPAYANLAKATYLLGLAADAYVAE